MKPLGWFGIVRLGLVQMALGAIVVLTTSTLNRVMVVELALPALVPGLLVAIHYAVQITRPRMGFGSDRSGRCTPWILGGMAVLALGGTLAAAATAWAATERVGGLVLAALAFFLVGLGVSACGTSLLVLLAKRVAPERRAPAATIVWMLMIVGFAVTAGLAGKWLEPYSGERLVVVSGSVSLIACAVALLALWRLEGEGGAPAEPESRLRFLDALRQVWQESAARRFTVFVFMSMLAFSAQDLILEPFAGTVFGLTPGATTQLSGLQHGGVLAGMIAAALAGSRWHIGSLRQWTIGGCLASALALAGLVAAGVLGPPWPLHATVFALGAANGAFSIAAIGSMMRMAGEGRAQREGVRMGLWGASQAIAFGIGGLAGALASDLTRRLIADTGMAYAVVFGAEALLFVWSAALAAGIDTEARAPRARRGAWTRSSPTMPS